MIKPGLIWLLLFVFTRVIIHGQNIDPYQPDFNTPSGPMGMVLTWHDEFNRDGSPEPATWSFEHGFVRNRELQWYQPENAVCKDGLLIIEGRKEITENPNFEAGSEDWRKNRPQAAYTSACIHTRGKKSWQFGRFEIRARIDSHRGAWPAIWTLGIDGRWPDCGEIDIMEFYRINKQSTILANAAWGDTSQWQAKWDDIKIPFAKFTDEDPNWVNKFHIWTMDWNQSEIQIYLDGELINQIDLSQTINPDGNNPFHQPHYLLLNLAIGSNGGVPENTQFPLKYEVDYVRVFQKN